MRGVSQISPPIRILLVAVLGLTAAWMLVLKPEEEPVPPAPAPAPNVQTSEPAVSQPGKIAESAQSAVDATNAKSKATENSDGSAPAAGAGTATQPGAAPGAKPGADPAAPTRDVKGLPKPVAKAIEARKVLVLLFWNPKSADDRVVRRNIRGVDRWKGDVSVHVAKVGQVSKYGRITRGAKLAQSPTTLVVDRNLKVTPLVGYADTKSVDQAVLDALRNSGGYLKDPYLAKVNDVCARVGGVSFDIPNPNDASEVPGYVASQKRIFSRLDARFAAIKAPARWRGFKRATVRDHKAMVAVLTQLGAAVGPNPTPARVAGALSRLRGRAAAVSKRYNERMDGQHLLSCGSTA
jgi:hypothetical protein